LGSFGYGMFFAPLALMAIWAVLAFGYAGGFFLRVVHVNALAILAVLGCVFLTEAAWLFGRDGYLLMRSAKPTSAALNDTDPSWFFFSPVERAIGLSHIALQRSATDPAAARRIFRKALYAANQIPADNYSVLFVIAKTQVKAGFFQDAEATIRQIKDRFQFELHRGVLAAEMARHGGRPHAQRLFDEALQQAKGCQEPRKRDRDLYLISNYQWSVGMSNEALRTAELIQNTPARTDLLQTLNDLSQLEIARQQAHAGRLQDAETTIIQHVKDPYRYCDGLISIVGLAATNATNTHARRILHHALQSAQQVESPVGRNSVIADVALCQFQLGLHADSQQTLALIDHAAVKADILKKLAAANSSAKHPIANQH
jgi:hypothetical protein